MSSRHNQRLCTLFSSKGFGRGDSDSYLMPILVCFKNPYAANETNSYLDGSLEWIQENHPDHNPKKRYPLMTFDHVAMKKRSTTLS
mmetsp:Transcript_2376/g.2742  ORF Transcript_2376/g.2742 Transcript_2376/m.2742 type:complete len:86 (-) Transcript_2376:109-366(-)